MLTELERKLIRLARDHAETPQMGRTHGQHAVPITFGFAMALYVSRLGQRIEEIARAAGNLRGKFAGAVGAYNALSLFRPADPETLEADLMRRLDLQASPISSQVVQPEYVADFVYKDRDGRQVVEDAKGVHTPVYRLKKRWMLAEHGIEIVEV